MGEEVNELRLVWYLVVLIGIGYLFPFSALIQPIDFWNLVFPGFNMEFPLSTLYMWTNLITLGLIVFLGKTPSYTFRIVGGFVGQLLVLILVPTMYFFRTSEHMYFIVVMSATALAATVTALVDSVAISFASQFPKAIIEALQLGIGLSTLIGCVYRIFTKLVLPNDTITSTVVYFYTGALTILICIIGYYVLLTLPIAQKYLFKTNPTSPTSINLVKDEEIGRLPLPKPTQHGEDATETTSLLSRPPIYATVSTDSAAASCCGKKACCCGGNGTCTCGNVTKLITPKKRSKWEVLSFVAWNEFLVFLTYFSSMLVWPGVMTEIKSHQYPALNESDWWSLLILFDFAVLDCIGRLMTPHRMGLTAENVWKPVFLRIFLLPIVFLCAMNIITWDIIAVIVVGIIGYTNGYLGSVCIICTTEIIEEEETAVVGGYTGFFLILGLVLGSSGAYISQQIVHMH